MHRQEECVEIYRHNSIQRHLRISRLRTVLDRSGAWQESDLYQANLRHNHDHRGASGGLSVSDPPE